MNKLFLISTLLIANTSFAQPKIDSCLVMLQSASKVNDNKMVILADNENYTISSQLNIVLDNLKSFLSKYPDLNEDEKLYSLLLKDTTMSKIDAIKISVDNKLANRLKYRTEELLDKGECMIFDKKNSTWVKSILVLKYSYVANYIAKTKFFIGNNLILEVQDIVDEGFKPIKRSQ